MANKKVSDLIPATTPLTGNELLFLSDGSGNSKKVTTQAVADLAGPGGGYTDADAIDAVGNALVQGTNITITYDSIAGTITIDAAGGGGGTGTVTSVDASGGTTGLTFSSGPITDSGTLTLSGTLAVTNGGTGAANAAGARANLGLSTMSTQNANSVTITGGSISGITDLAIADGGTGASTASAARSNL